MDSAGLLKAIDEETPTEPNKKWIKRDKAAKQTILNHLDDSLLGYTIGSNLTAKVIFQRLDQEFKK